MKVRCGENMENIYLITGDELFEREQEVYRIKSQFGELVKGINFVTLDKDTLHLLLGEITTYPFGFNKKLIILNIDAKSSASEEQNAKNDWFTVDDIIHFLVNIFEVPANIDMVNGVFKRNKSMFTSQQDPNNKKAYQRKLLSAAKDFAAELVAKAKAE